MERDFLPFFCFYYRKSTLAKEGVDLKALNLCLVHIQARAATLSTSHSLWRCSVRTITFLLFVERKVGNKKTPHDDNG